MSLPPVDMAFLNERGIVHEIIPADGMTCVVLPEWPLPAGLDREVSDLLIRLHPGYPDVQPDMWWFAPAVHLADGRELPQTNVIETYFGRSWQRWSRHFNGGQWKPGIDGLESYLALIRHELLRGTPAGVR